MVKKVKANKKKALAVKSSSSKRKNRRMKTKMGIMRTEGKLMKAAQLISDPCNGPLGYGVGDGYNGAVSERQRTTIVSPSNNASNVSGYIVWFPSYHGATGVGGNANLYYFETATPAVAPVNTIANPMGTTVNTSGTFLADPTSASISAGGAFTRAKCLSACVQMAHIGTLQTTAGQICTVRNLSLAAFNTNYGTVSPFQPMSVDQLFGYAHERQRFNIDGHEVVWRPADNSSVLRSNGADPAIATYEPDVLFIQGNPTVNTTSSAVMDPSSVMGIAIGFRGLSPGLSSTMFNFVKCSELELAPRNNLMEEMPRPVPGPRYSISQVTDYLDSVDPSWQSHLMSKLGGAATAAVKTFAPTIVDMFKTKLYIKDGSL